MKAKLNMRRYTRALSKKKIIIVVVFILSIAVGFAFNYKTKDNIYRATANVYCDSGKVLIEGKIVQQNYTDIVMSKKIADRAASILDDEKYTGDMIKKMVSCTFSRTSPVYKIHVAYNDYNEVINIVNAVATAFVMEINVLTECNAEVLDRAYESRMIFNGRNEQIKNIALFALVGTLISILIIIILASMSKKIETVDDVTLDGEIEILGVIPNFDVE